MSPGERRTTENLQHKQDRRAQATGRGPLGLQLEEPPSVVSVLSVLRVLRVLTAELNTFKHSHLVAALLPFQRTLSSSYVFSTLAPTRDLLLQ